MRRPWYIGSKEWTLRGGWTRERDLVWRCRMRLIAAVAIGSGVLYFGVGVLWGPIYLGGSVLN